MESEYFIPLKGYEELYIISNYGTIKSIERRIKNRNGYRKHRSRIMKAKTDNHGYFRIGLTKDKKQKFYFVHRLVAETFIPNHNNYPVVNHIDGNKKNNYVQNLEWCTYQENTIHAFKIGLKTGKTHIGVRGEKNGNSKLKDCEVTSILEEKKKGVNRDECYLKYKDKISYKGFEQIWYRTVWKHIKV